MRTKVVQSEPLPDIWQAMGKEPAGDGWESWHWAAVAAASIILDYLDTGQVRSHRVCAFDAGAAIGFVLGQTCPQSPLDWKKWIAEASKAGELREYVAKLAEIANAD